MSLPRTATLDPAVAVDVVPGQGVVLRGAHGSTVLLGRCYEPLVEQLRRAPGQEVDELADRLERQHGRIEVYYALGQLLRGGAIRSSEVLMDVVPAREPGVLPSGVRLVGRLPVASLVSHLTDFSEGPGLPDVVFTDDYLRDEVEAHAEALKGREWILCRPVGQEIWIGPRFARHGVPCWSCLAARLQRNRPLDRFIRERLGQEPEIPALPWSDEGLERAASALARVRSGDSPMASTVLVIPVAEGTARKHDVPPRPQCARCGDPSLYPRRAERPVSLRSCRTTFRADGGHRVCTPTESLAARAHLTDPLFGIVTDLARAVIPGAPELEVHGAEASHTGTPFYLSDLVATTRIRCGGKGVSRDQSAASAVGEAVERYCGVFQGDEVRLHAPREQLGTQAIDPNDVLLYSDRQLALAADGAVGFDASRTLRLPPDEPIDWTPLWSLDGSSRAYLPTALLYHGHPSRADRRYSLPSSNGAASGNTMEEAVLQALLEVVERDAAAIWWYNRLGLPGLSCEGLGEDAERIMARYRTLGREVAFVDLTTDLAIPTVAAVSWLVKKVGASEGLILGLGAHVDPRIAGLRALTEMAQSLNSWAIFRAGEPVAPEVHEWFERADREREPYMDPGAATRSFSDLPRIDTDDLLEDIRAVAERLTRAALTPFVLDQTRPDVRVPVCQVVVPGLRPIVRGLAPGRLYSVPEALGHTAASEQDMNPVEFFL